MPPNEDLNWDEVVDEWEVSDSWVIVQTQGSNWAEEADKNGRLACPI